MASQALGPIPPTTLQLYTMHFTLCQTTFAFQQQEYILQRKSKLALQIHKNLHFFAYWLRILVERIRFALFNIGKVKSAKCEVSKNVGGMGPWSDITLRT
jgi:hypothetical protein